jgi:hypothetical protein
VVGDMNTFLAVLAIVAPIVSAVLVAVLNNWDKINRNKTVIREVRDITTETKETVETTKADVEAMKAQLKNLSIAQRTGLQTMILEKCKRINQAINVGDVNYEEELKQLIILYREYHSCGYNSQGKLYFNDTIAKASESNNVMVRELMNTYFAEYEP